MFHYIDIISDLLLRRTSSLGYVTIVNFSFKHNKHIFVMFVYAGSIFYDEKEWGYYINVTFSDGRHYEK